jgi:PAS domain S-box-containing protein
MSPVRKRILIVEDQRLIAADLENTLGRIGYEVIGSVASGEEAVPRAIETRPDLILMDIRLRGKMDGIQAAEAIRAQTDVPVVYLTAYADEETILRAKGTTPFGFVVKPFNERELRAAIEVAIFKHETDRLLIEERARRRAAEEFKLLVDGVMDYAIFMLDPTGRIASWNEGARRIKGYAAEEILGTHFSVFHPPEDVAAGRPAAVLAQALADGRAEREGWRLRKDGSRFWANVVITPLRDERGQLHGFGKVARDLTERKHQEEMKQFLDRATVTLAGSLDPISTLEQAARIIVPELADWCLIDLVDEGGRLTQVAVAHVDREKEDLARGLARTLAAQPGLEHGPLHVLGTGKPEVHPDVGDADRAAKLLGTEHPELLRRLGLYSYMCLPIQFRGRTLGVLSLLRGSPPRRYGASDLAFAEELSRRIGLAVENARLYREAQEAIRARDEFLQIASHELKTPLTPLQLQLDSLGRMLEKAGVLKMNERLTSALTTAIRQTTRLSRLVESLLDVSRITVGRVALDVEPFDLADLIREVADRFRGEARKAGSSLDVRVDGPLLGQWDHLRVEQILSNVLSNAIKYGSGKPIEVESRLGEGAVTVAVTDHGIGIEKHAMLRIFGRFERAVSVRNFGGLGLGLFIARQLAEAHGGTILAQSEPGAGSTFTIVLPLVGTFGGEAAATHGDQRPA